METVILTPENPVFTITGGEEKMSTELVKVLLHPPLSEPPLQLQVTDENDLLLYSKPLLPKPGHPDDLPVKTLPEVAINKRFIFNRQLHIQVTGQAGASFRVEVQYL